MNQKSIIRSLKEKVFELQKRNKELTESCENFVEVDMNLWKRIGLLQEENKELKLKLADVIQGNSEKVRHISHNCGKLDLRCDYCSDGKCKSRKRTICIFRKIEDWRLQEIE